MELFRFIPVRLTVLVMAGILIGHCLEPPPPIALAGSGLCMLILLAVHRLRLKRRSNPLFNFSAGIAAILTGLTAYSLSVDRSRLYHYSKQDLEGHKLLHLKIREVLRPNRHSNNFIAEVRSADGEVADGSILLRLSQTEFGRECMVDDELVVAALLKPIPAPPNPYQFDYRKYMESKGIYHQADPPCELVFFVNEPVKTLKGAAASLRNSITAGLLASGFSTDELAVVQALLMGQRQGLPDTVYDNYKDAGAVHILAVSGLHIGILLWLLQFILRPFESFPRGKSLKLLLLICLLWSYAFLAGFSPSVIRAVAMFSFVAYALYLNRPSNTFNILALSMFFILLAFDAGLLFQAGFQMSYAAVFAILSIYPFLQSAFRPRSWLPGKVWQLFSVSLAAQLGVLPISLYYFHQFPGLFFITNLLVIPFLGVILGTGFLVAVLTLARVLPVQLARTYEALIAAMNNVVELVADKEAFLFREIPFDGTQLVLAYILLIAGCMLLARPSYRRLVFVLLAVLSIQLRQVAGRVLLNGREQLWLMHQNRNTLLLHQYGNLLTVMASSPPEVEGLVSRIRVARAIHKTRYIPLSDSYQWGNNELHIIRGKPGNYLESSGRARYLLLRSSPKVNLDRIIDIAPPFAVIADGSNYPSFVSRWRKTCRRRGIPFHDTATDGAYRFLAH